MATTPWSDMHEITGEQRRDYFHVLCAKCGQHVDVLYKGYVGGVPEIETSCKTCSGDAITLKLTPGKWEGLPLHSN